MEGKEKFDIQHPEAWELLVSIEDKRVDYILFSPSVPGSLAIGQVERADESLQGLEDAVYETPDLLNDYSLNYNSKPLAQQAQELFDKGIDRAKATKHWELLTTAFFNLANQNYDLDLRKYDILFSKEIPDSTPDLQYARLQYRAIEHMQRKEYDAARRCFEQQLAAVSTLWAPERDTLATLMSIATTYRLERKNAHSIEKYGLHNPTFSTPKRCFSKEKTNTFWG